MKDVKSLPIQEVIERVSASIRPEVFDLDGDAFLLKPKGENHAILACHLNFPIYYQGTPVICIEQGDVRHEYAILSTGEEEAAAFWQRTNTRQPAISAWHINMIALTQGITTVVLGYGWPWGHGLWAPEVRQHDLNAVRLATPDTLYKREPKGFSLKWKRPAPLH